MITKQIEIIEADKGNIESSTELKYFFGYIKNFVTHIVNNPQFKEAVEKRKARKMKRGSFWDQWKRIEATIKSPVLNPDKEIRNKDIRYGDSYYILKIENSIDSSEPKEIEATKEEYLLYIRNIYDFLVEYLKKDNSPSLDKTRQKLSSSINTIEILDVRLDEDEKTLTIMTPGGKRVIGFKKKRVKERNKNFDIRNTDKLNEIGREKKETKFYKAFASFFEKRKEVSKFSSKEIFTDTLPINIIAGILKVSELSVRNYIKRINTFIEENALPIKLDSDKKGNYQLFVKIGKK